MDLDDLDAPSQVPSRVSRFAPKFSKLKPKSKSELASAQESLGSVLPKTETGQTAPKPEPQEFEAKKEKEIDAKPKPENGFVKMEVDSAAGAKEEPEENDSMEVEAEEDMVVREIDVFFNPKIDEGTQLYVLQYPLRPSWRPYELDERCEEVRVKPASSEVEMDLSLDVDSKNYDPDCGDRLNMTKQTLCCSWDQPRATRYAVGVLMGNKLHLNRIHAVMQLRPSLKHLISAGSKKKNNVKVDAEDTVKLEESSGKKAIGSSKKQIKQENSSVKQKIADEEGWVPLKYHGSESESSVRYLRKMAVQESSPLQFTMSPYDYLNSLCPGSCKNGNEPKGPSRRALLSLPLEERIKSLLCEGLAPVHRFSVLKHFAPDCTTKEILDALQNHALLVQGLWAPKSSLLLGTSKETGAQRIARDYVLLLFWKNPVFSFSSLHFPSSLKTAVNKFLNILGVERPSVKDWKFKGQTDISFIKNYPDVVKKQEEVWGDLERDIMNMFGDGKSGRGPKNTSIPSRPVKPLNSNKGVPKGTSEVVGGKKIPDDIREVLCSKILPKVIQEHKVCSLQLMCQGLRELALNKLNLPKADDRFARAAACGTASPGELVKLLDETAINIHGLYVLKSSAEHPQYDPFRNVVIDLLRQNGLAAKLKKAEIFDAAKNALKRDVTSNEYSKVMNEICVFKGSCWMLKSGDGNPK
ncbi:DNA-directed RNA polymerase III subunit RPC5 [Morus notabilis]|uniref:DNA-directed RNA polymerase III subunit RPC5 n=1 Tax=Morus notabilis TaxID=981085 RepID=UPI000CECF9F0|nr:DNA-directed RNA polymerase III subunit RPC5 [Morus notabilis]